jgi:putative hemolysin
MWGIAALVIIVFCVYWYENETKGFPAPWQTQTASTTTPGGQGVGLANPASTNCITLGGTLEIVNDAQSGGQVGFCHMKDGRTCEEWALFRDGSCVAP